MTGLFEKIAPIIVAVCVSLGLASAPNLAQAQSDGGPYADTGGNFDTKEWGLLLFGGEMSDNNFLQTINPTIAADRQDIYFFGAALSKRIYEGSYIDMELEGGVGSQWGDGSGNDTGQIWGALYFRYDDFPWNHWIKTSVAANIGLNYAFDEIEFEKDGSDSAPQLQNYFAPEITFAHPDYDEWEGVFRLHHRSAVFGVFGCGNCGSNMVTGGIRKRF